MGWLDLRGDQFALNEHLRNLPVGHVFPAEHIVRELAVDGETTFAAILLSHSLQIFELGISPFSLLLIESHVDEQKHLA